MDRREFDRRGKKDKMKDKTDSAERGDTRKQNKRETWGILDRGYMIEMGGRDGHLRDDRGAGGK